MRTTPVRLLVGIVVGLGAFALVVIALPRRNVWMIMVAALLVVLLVRWLRSPPLHLAFEFGEQQRHRVVVHVDKFWGNLSIKIDGKSVRREVQRSWVGLTRMYVVTVGEPDRHEIRVENDRSPFSAGSRPQPVRAYLDGVLTAEGIA